MEWAQMSCHTITGPLNKCRIPSQLGEGMDLIHWTNTWGLDNIAALNDRSVLLLSDYSPKSFDGQYFGLMDKSQIISAVRPVWTW